MTVVNMMMNEQEKIPVGVKYAAGTRVVNSAQTNEFLLINLKGDFQ